MAETQRVWVTSSQRNEPNGSVCVDPCSTDHVHRLPGWQQTQTIILIPSPINLGLARPATACTESISFEIWAAVTAVTDFGMQDSPLIDKETEINSQFGLGMRLKWIKENSFYSPLLCLENPGKVWWTFTTSTVKKWIIHRLYMSNLGGADMIVWLLLCDPQFSLCAINNVLRKSYTLVCFTKLLHATVSASELLIFPSWREKNLAVGSSRERFLKSCNRAQFLRHFYLSTEAVQPSLKL